MFTPKAVQPMNSTAKSAQNWPGSIFSQDSHLERGYYGKRVRVLAIAHSSAYPGMGNMFCLGCTK
jgi:hypothetical protein